LCAGEVATICGTWSPANQTYGRVLATCGGNKNQNATLANPRCVNITTSTTGTCTGTWMNQSGTVGTTQIYWEVR
jgi:hypothetical protein